MKRDCGEGDLYPTHWIVKYCIGTKDEEHSTEKLGSVSMAMRAFLAKEEELRSKPYSNVRLYAGDKEGYLNCIAYIQIKDVKGGS
jgi:hypothetical protein